MTLVGGIGTLSGPITGSALIVSLENKLGDLGHGLAAYTHVDAFELLGESITAVIGLILIVCVISFRRGIMGEVNAAFGRGMARR
jgi:branched-chain amino acid transport system permease protein